MELKQQMVFEFLLNPTPEGWGSDPALAEYNFHEAVCESENKKPVI
jgi:hypothetical protein